MINLRARFARDREGGFALVFVILVTTAIMAAVATTLTVTTPNIVNGKNDESAAAAYLAAQSGVDDVIAYLDSKSACRSTTKICSEALGASSTRLGRGALGDEQSFSWTTESSLTAEGYVRIHSTGTADGITRNLTADLSLAPSILSFGYYTDYESQSPTYLQDEYAARTVALTNQSTYSDIDATNTSNRRITVTDPTTVQWDGPNGPTGKDPVGICGEHYYYESASSPGRYQNLDSSTGQSLWGETGSIVTGRTTNNVLRTSSCDVVFTTGMTMDGPIYTRDALFISDGSRNTGPIFKQPVYTLWGFGSNSTPMPSVAAPWRADKYSGGIVDPSSPYKPQIAGLDLELPTTIGTDGLPDNYCLYTGPTRVVLNGDGTATVTSPGTTTKNSASDSQCYPSGSISSGILDYTLSYKDIGDPTIYVQERGTKPSAGWPDNPTKSTNTPSTSNEVFYLPAAVSTATPDQTSNEAAPSSACADKSGTRNDVLYKNTASWTCAWTGVAKDTDATSSTGWTTSTSKSCSNTIAATYRQLFECEYAGKSGQSVTAPSSGYGAVRSTVQASLSSGTCLNDTAAKNATCLEGIVNADLQQANTSGHAYNYASPKSGDHRYVATATVGSSSQGTPQSFGSLPTNPVSGDSMFTYTGSKAQEAATKSTINVTVNRQTYSNGSWGSSVPQFTFTVTQSTWAVTSQASGEAYFPDTDDVSDYNTGADNNGAAAGSSGANQPGDLYVEGDNTGKLSLIAQDDVIVTGDMTNPKDSSYNDVYNPNTNAVDIVAGNNVRNYHPVQCVDQTAADIDATSVGWCPNDITGLYQGGFSSNDSSNPARQYTNILGTGARTIDAALFAMAGSFLTDNYNRGVPLGNLTVNGGIYQSHRGANGVTGSTSGYSLQYHYIDLEHANLPYAPPATGGSTSRVWNVVSLSAGNS